MIKDIQNEMKERGYAIVYKPHEVMKDYNATYNVIYEGKRITNPAGIKLKIPTNEIWISEKWRKYEKYILFHEFTEIKFRAMGLGIDEAHYLAEMECIKRFRDDALWRKFVVELHISDVENIATEIQMHLRIKNKQK